MESLMKRSVYFYLTFYIFHLLSIWMAFTFCVGTTRIPVHSHSHTHSHSINTASATVTARHNLSKNSTIISNPRQILNKLAASYNKPEQIHVSFGSHATNIIIMWSSSSGEKSFVEYGNTPQAIHRVPARSTELKDHSEHATKFIHRAELKDLTPGTHYTYRIISGSSGVKSQVLFVDVPHNDRDKPYTFMVVADMGLLTRSLQFVVHEALDNRYQAVFHVGDIAYDLDTQGGSFGDQYMNRIQRLASKVAYMTIPGDHERSFDFYHYRHRFSTPGAHWPMKEEELWYSIDIGHTHIIGINTQAVHSGEKFQKMQIDWMKKDLAKANQNRQSFPWIIVMGHRPLYCSKTTTQQDCDQEYSKMREALEDLFFEYGVDLYISGHKHCYERSWPVYKSHSFEASTVDPRAPIHVIVGTMGYQYKFHEQKSQPKWLAASYTEKDREVFARLKIINSSHLEWSAHVATNNKKVDEMMIIQHRHGSFGSPGQIALDRLKLKVPPINDLSSIVIGGSAVNDLSSIVIGESAAPSKIFSIHDPMNRNVLLFVGVFSFSFLVFLFMRYSRVQCFTRR